ncbi:sulfite:cytochrome C oxidoreductase subunit B [Haloferula sp. BvORR071]|uniref:SorB family sulfite dehydrogenase c-type cytochrome subunit n=1 Tax=Haloferula sp. BvORR071 TaxID=1396141 RepID=UPI0005519279|nr:sulfite:cytochrome C oxidoreductase subunit B [Haloferula sp. BvORR071]
MKRTILFLPLLVVPALLSRAEVKKIELPLEPAKFKEGKGAELAQAHCFTCHSVEYIATQPVMPRKFWEATVLKMRDKYAAPLPEDAVQPLIDYLTENYGKK